MIVSYNDEDETWKYDRYDERDRYDWHDAVAPILTQITEPIHQGYYTRLSTCESNSTLIIFLKNIQIFSFRSSIKNYLQGVLRSAGAVYLSPMH